MPQRRHRNSKSPEPHMMPGKRSFAAMLLPASARGRTICKRPRGSSSDTVPHRSGQQSTSAMMSSHPSSRNSYQVDVQCRLTAALMGLTHSDADSEDLDLDSDDSDSQPLLTPRMLQLILAYKPTTLEALRLVPTIGSATAQRLGRRVVDTVSRCITQQALPPPLFPPPSSSLPVPVPPVMNPCQLLEQWDAAATTQNTKTAKLLSAAAPDRKAIRRRRPVFTIKLGALTPGTRSGHPEKDSPFADTDPAYTPASDAVDSTVAASVSHRRDGTCSKSAALTVGQHDDVPLSVRTDALAINTMAVTRRTSSRWSEFARDGAPWTAEEELWLLRNWQQKHTVSWLSQQLCRTKSAVKARLKQHRHALVSPPPLPETSTLAPAFSPPPEVQHDSMDSGSMRYDDTSASEQLDVSTFGAAHLEHYDRMARVETDTLAGARKVQSVLKTWAHGAQTKQETATAIDTPKYDTVPPQSSAVYTSTPTELESCAELAAQTERADAVCTTTELACRSVPVQYSIMTLRELYTSGAAGVCTLRILR